MKPRTPQLARIRWHWTLFLSLIMAAGVILGKRF